jgi:hypothetical protein
MSQRHRSGAAVYCLTNNNPNLCTLLLCFCMDFCFCRSPPRPSPPPVFPLDLLRSLLLWSHRRSHRPHPTFPECSFSSSRIGTRRCGSAGTRRTRSRPVARRCWGPFPPFCVALALAFGPYNAIWQQPPLCWRQPIHAPPLYHIGDDFDKAEDVLFGIPLCTAGFTSPAWRTRGRGVPSAPGPEGASAERGRWTCNEIGGSARLIKARLFIYVQKTERGFGGSCGVGKRVAPLAAVPCTQCPFV